MKTPSDHQCSCNHSQDPRGWPDATQGYPMTLPDAGGVLRHPAVKAGTYILPVCDECYSTLTNENDTEWILFVCGNCASAQWAHRSFTRGKYPEDAKVIVCEEGCPNCITMTGVKNTRQ